MAVIAQISGSVRLAGALGLATQSSVAALINSGGRSDNKMRGRCIDPLADTEREVYGNHSHAIAVRRRAEMGSRLASGT